MFQRTLLKKEKVAVRYKGTFIDLTFYPIIFKTHKL